MNYKINDKWGKYTVTGIQTIIHGKYFPNTSITHRIALKGQGGRKATADVYSGKDIGTLRNYSYFEGETVLDGR